MPPASPPPHLTETDLVARGLDGWPLGLEDITHFHELDPLGHVNNIAYLQWCENARILWLMRRGLTRYSGQEPRYVVHSQQITYHREMGLTEPYIITIRAKGFRRTSFSFEYAIFSQDTLRATAHSVMVQLTPDGSAKLPLSQELRVCFLREGAVEGG